MGAAFLGGKDGRELLTAFSLFHFPFCVFFIFFSPKLSPHPVKFRNSMQQWLKAWS
jgi:hypothetical protein